MLQTWNEIESRYDAIKDHKPRASKKLAELGLILASAYQLSPERADEMWQYIIDLNLSDDVSYSKFYVYQLYNKISELLPSDAATNFLTMRVDRAKLYCLWGNFRRTGSSVNFVFCYLLKNHRIPELLDIVNFLNVQYCTFNEDFPQGVPELFACDPFLWYVVWIIYKPQQNDLTAKEVSDFCQICEEYCTDDTIRAIFFSMKCNADRNFNFEEEIVDKNIRLLFQADDWITPCLAETLLYGTREMFAEQKIVDVLEGYCQFSVDPVIIGSEIRLGDDPACAWFISLAENSDCILTQCFLKKTCYNFVADLVEKWIRDCNWKNLVHYLVLALNNADKRQMESYIEKLNSIFACYQGAKEEIHRYDGEYDSDDEDGYDSDDEYFEYGSCVTENSIQDFMIALGKVCFLTLGSEFHSELLACVKSGVLEETGTLDILKEAGFTKEDLSLCAEVSTWDNLCQYCAEQIASMPPYTALRWDGIFWGYVKELQENEPEQNVWYRLAFQEDIIQALFLHHDNFPRLKADIVLSLLTAGEYARVRYLSELLIETTKYPNYSEKKGWQKEYADTTTAVLSKVLERIDPDSLSPICKEATEVVTEIAQISLQYLDQSAQKQVKLLLMVLEPDESAVLAYIEELRKDISDYTALPRPRGFSYRKDEVISDIRKSFEILGKLNRIDFIAEILYKLDAAKSHLVGRPFIKWVSDVECLNRKQFHMLYPMIPHVFASFLEEARKSNWRDYGVVEMTKFEMRNELVDPSNE